VARRPPIPPAWILLLGAALLYACYRVHEILIPFLLSFAFAYLLNPVLKDMEVRGFRRDILVIGIYLLIAAVLTVAASTLIPAITRELALLSGKAPVYITKTQALASQMQHDLAQRLPFGQEAAENWSLKLYEPVFKQLPKIPKYVLGLFPLFSLLFLVPFITFFILLDSKNLLQHAIQVVPSRYVEQVLHIISEVDTALGNYIRGVMIIVITIGVTSYIGLMTLRVDYALAVATLAGISSFIPYLGAVLGAAVGALVAFFQYHNITVPLQVILLFTAIRMADEAFVQPLVSRHSVHLHPLVFLFALMTGGKVFGFVGLLFAVPAACIIKSLIVVAWDWYVTEAQMKVQTVSGSSIPYI